MNRPSKNGHVKRSAYDTIKQLILSAELQPGQAVTEIALSQRLGISRTPIREALGDLEQEGLIVTANRRKRVYLLSVHEVEDIFDLKIEIEGAVARWAAQRGSGAQHQRLASISKRMNALAQKRPASESRESQWLKQWLGLDGHLHSTLFEAAGNQRARQTISTLNVQWHQLKVGMLTLEGRVEKSAQEHACLVAAVSARQPTEARKCMQVHLQNLRREMIKLMKLLQYPAE